VDARNSSIGKVGSEVDSYPSALNEQARRGLRRSVQSAPLIGREAELGAVLRLVADPSVRLVSLVGRGGVGKTRLALEMAWALDASQPGSVGVVSLASVPGSQKYSSSVSPASLFRVRWYT
jgi:ATP-dependent Clp protease ATP-binding subunit ClpA